MKILSLVVIGLVGCNADSEGPPGPEGPAGERGSDGAPGPQGERGPLGPQGDRGTRGDEGIRGESGERGERGEQGVPGSVGPVGPQGPAGPSGADGASCFGESLPDGMQITCGEETLVLRHGEDGDPGEPGSPGAMGVQGSPGPVGEVGPQGEPGPVGPEGIPGRDGISCIAQDILEGVQITCGNVSVLIRHGEQGPQGERGEQGSPGQNGENAQCPEESQELRFNGYLMYCVRRFIFDDPVTWIQCRESCLNAGLHMMRIVDLSTLCLAQPDFFADIPVVGSETFEGDPGTCEDGMDNDNDGRTDCEDNNCAFVFIGCYGGVHFHLEDAWPGAYGTQNTVLRRTDTICSHVRRLLDGDRLLEDAGSLWHEFLHWSDPPRISATHSRIPSPPYDQGAQAQLPHGCLCGKRL